MVSDSSEQEGRPSSFSQMSTLSTIIETLELAINSVLLMAVSIRRICKIYNYNFSLPAHLLFVKRLKFLITLCLSLVVAHTITVLSLCQVSFAGLGQASL